jgi:hypothetical protein
MKTMVKIIFLISISWLTGCAGGPYVGSLDYSQVSGLNTTASLQNKSLTVAPFKDSRVDYPESDKRIGRLVGGFGETLQAIDIQESLSLAVGDTVSEFLKDAGYNTDKTSKLTLSGDIVQFYTMFHFAHKVAIEINLTLTDNDTKKEVWKGTASSYFGGSLFDRYPTLKDDIDCGFGYSCHSKGINVAMNKMLTEALVDAWKNGGLSDAIKNYNL